VDGSDALVFPALPDRVNGIRGPLTIDGAPSISGEQFLNSPFRLPGETNFPLADGAIRSIVNNPDGTTTLTDINPTHVQSPCRDRPGVGPRTTEVTWLYPCTLRSGQASGVSLAVAWVSSDMLSFARPTGGPIG